MHRAIVLNKAGLAIKTRQTTAKPCIMAVGTYMSADLKTPVLYSPVLTQFIRTGILQREKAKCYHSTYTYGL